jgi:hypothetical protein
MHPNVLKDMNVTYVPLPSPLSHKNHIIVNDDIVFINTWVGAYFDMGLKHTNECTLRFLYEIYRGIYHTVSDLFDVQIKLESIDKYFPLCNYSKLDVCNIDNWLNQNTQKKVLISNGPCHSGQCDFNGDMVEIINLMAEQRKDLIFIVTQKIKNDHDNVVCTSDITKIADFDLNEISYLSTHCDIIIGRNSGPLCFCSTKENLNDPKKTFFSFGTRETDCLTYGIKTQSKQIFQKYTDIISLKKSLLNLINKSF